MSASVATPPVSWRVHAFRAIASLISLALFAWLLTDRRWHGVGTRLRRIDASALVGVAAAFAVSYAMRGARIHGEFRDELAGHGSMPRRYLRILRLTLVHNALVNLLPFRSGEVAFPLLLSRWFGIPTARAVVSLLWLRAQDALVVLVLAACAWPGLAPAWRALAVVAAIAIAIGVPAWARRHRSAIATDDGPRPGTPDRPRLAKIGALLERSTRRSASGWAWTVGNWFVKLAAETWLLALALGPVPGVASPAASGAIGAELAAILPIQGIAGFGTFEAGAALLMRTQDVSMAVGLEAALVLHAVVLALALAAGALAAVLLPGVPRD